jgi:hypothetical protein
MTPTGHDPAQSIVPPPHRPAIPAVLIYILHPYSQTKLLFFNFFFPRFLQNEGDYLQVERHNIPEIPV